MSDHLVIELDHLRTLVDAVVTSRLGSAVLVCPRCSGQAVVCTACGGAGTVTLGANGLADPRAETPVPTTQSAKSLMTPSQNFRRSYDVGDTALLMAEMEAGSEGFWHLAVFVELQRANASMTRMHATMTRMARRQASP